MARTITLSDDSYERIVVELEEAKNALEAYASEEGVDFDSLDPADYEGFEEEREEWASICEALRELH